MATIDPDAAAAHDHHMHGPTVAVPASANAVGVASAPVASLTSLFKRALVGRPQSSAKLSETLLPKRIALPVFASDALSSNAYATQEILLVLSLGGLAYFHFTPWVAAGVVLVFFVVVASYRQNVHAYPSGGGDYENVSVNLGANAGVVVASALLVDYVMTVAVSIAAAVDNIVSAFDPLERARRARWRSLLIAVITLPEPARRPRVGNRLRDPDLRLHGRHLPDGRLGRSSGSLSGAELQAESANWELVAEGRFTGLALVYLVARAFTSGTTALTGVEAISNGVPAFQKPKSKNAATTLAAARRHLDDDVRLDHLAGAVHRRQGGREQRRPDRAARRGAAEDRHRPGRQRGLQQRARCWPSWSPPPPR